MQHLHYININSECPIHKCGWDCKTDCYCAAEITGKHQIDGVCPYGCSERWTGTDQKCNIGKESIHLIYGVFVYYNTNIHIQLHFLEYVFELKAICLSLSHLII